MILASNWRFRVENQTNQQIEIGGVSIVFTRWRFDESGVPVYDAPVTVANVGALALSTGNEALGPYTNDGAGEGWLGLDARIVVANLNAGVGEVAVYYETSPDGALWPDIKFGRPVFAHRFTGSGTVNRQFSIN